MPRQQQSVCLLVVQVATLTASKLHALMSSFLPADWCKSKANGRCPKDPDKIQGWEEHAAQRKNVQNGAAGEMVPGESGNRTSMKPLT